MGSPHGIPFGNYQLLKRLARGGMAEVFLARQSGLEGFDRVVALKRILPHLVDNDDFVRMFLDEARLAARLSHPHIIHIYEFGKVDEHYFIAMEFLAGVHVGDLIRAAAKDPIPEALIARLGADACAGLHYAHQLRDELGRPLQLVHRDISPPNLLVSHDGVVKIVDFGIAKAVNCVEKTRPGVVKGKYAYMSPEQTTGKSLDGHSDVFSLALVLWELLAGKVAIPRTDQIAAMKMIRDGKIPDIREARPSISPAIADALSMALQVSPSTRCDARTLGVALEECIKSSDSIGSSLELAQWLETRFPREPIIDQEEVLVRGTQQATMATRGTGAVAAAIAAAQPRSADPSAPPSSGSMAQVSSSSSKTDSSDTVALHSSGVLEKVATLGQASHPSTVVPPPEHTAMGSNDFATAQEHELHPGAHQSWQSSQAAAYGYTPSSFNQVANYGPSTISDRRGTPKLVWVVVAGLSLGIGGTAALTMSRSSGSPPEPVVLPSAIVTEGLQAEKTTPDAAPSRPAKDNRPPESAEEKFGGLEVVTDPAGAAIAFGDASPSAISPASFYDVAAGEHRLVISLDGYQTVTRDITVQPGKIRPVAVALLPNVVEEAASVEPKRTETNKKRKNRVARQSSSSRRATTSNHATAAATPPKDKQSILSSSILGQRPSTQPGKLIVRTRPYSEVYHQGKRLGQTPASIELPPGKYVLTFKNPDFSDTKRTVTIKSGDTRRLSFSLD